MGNIFLPEVPVAEKILRSAVVYLSLLIVFRFTGKRQVGQLTPFDLIVLLILSNVVQDALIGGDNSIGGALIGVGTIFLLNSAFVEITYRFKKARRLLESKPTLLIHDGRILEDNLRQERITHDELLAALRRSGLVEASQARFAVLEETGGISVIPWTTPEKEPSK